jgi:predicted AlkP superfamily phosphohydrolase/phosphomutase
MGDRVLIIGLDGATWTVLLPWMEDGSLPNLARLRAEGSWGDLMSTIPPLTAPAWSTFLTGKNPGKHGVFHFIPLDDAASDAEEMQQKANKIEVVDARSIQSATLWDILGHQNRKVGAINVPMSYPARPVNGFMITCLLTPPQASIFTYPPELSKQLTDYQIDLDRFIDEKPFARDVSGARKKRIVKPSLQLVKEFEGMEDKRARAALDLMTTQPWDTFMVVFTATDRMGHYLWPYHQKPSEGASEEHQALYQAVHNLYKRLDSHIGELIQQAGENTTVFVMSDHGMGPIYHKNTHWNNWLYKNGFLAIDQRSAKSVDGWLLRLRIPRDSIRRVLKRIPGLYGSKVVQKAKEAPTARIDYAHSKAHYVKIFDPVGGIYVHAKGDERERLRDELIRKIRETVDPTNGKPIVRNVYRREECFWGEHVDDLPDIIIEMHPEYGSSDRLSNYSSIVTDRPQISDPGGHHIEGVFIAKGPKTVHIADPLPGLNIADLAPTILYAMGLPIPEDMDGKVLTQIFDPAIVQAQPAQYGSTVGRWPSEEEAQPILEKTQSGEEAIVERLRALGYVK